MSLSSGVQHSDSVTHTKYTHIYIYSFSDFYRLLQNIEQSFLPTQQVLFGYQSHIQQCVYVNPYLLIFPPSPSLVVYFILISAVGCLLHVSHVIIHLPTSSKFELEFYPPEEPRWFSAPGSQFQIPKGKKLRPKLSQMSNLAGSQTLGSQHACTGQ